MEEWEKILESYEINCDIKTFNTIIRSAKCALNEDLAPFESDWVFSTLLKKPVNLLEVVAEQRMSDEYSKCVVEALKLLGDAVDKYDNFEKYYEEVAQLCLLQYPAVPRQYALSCLNRLARRAPCAARGLRGHVAALQQGVCMAPLAILIGTICEHHPHVAADDVVNIWRVLLNLLDSHKYSGTVMKAVLQGIFGLFKHFGDELPTMELIKFYEQLVAHLEINSCQEVCLAILTHHAHLFFTCVNRDASTRALLWRLNAFHALQAVYTVCDESVLREVKTYMSSPHERVRRAARRVLGERGHAEGTGEGGGDVHELEDALRNGRGDLELLDKICWSIQTKAQSNHRLLQAAMLFYDSFPATARTELVQAILNTHTRVLNAATTFLIAETIRNQKLTIWQDILKCDSEKLTTVYDNINKYINTIVEGVAEGLDGPPLSSLLPLLLSLPPRAPLHCAVPQDPCDISELLAAFSGGVNISIHDGMEDEVKIKCSLVVLCRMEEHAYPAGVCLAALQTIFSTKNLEAAILSEAVNALDVLVRGQRVDECVLAEIIHNLEKIRSRTDKTKKADRILYRDKFMFVGKHRKMEFNDNDLNSLTVELKNILTIQIPHETGILKISLDGLLHSALQMEDEDALNFLLSVICANLSSSGAPALQRVLLRVCVCLSYTHAYHTHILEAVRVCDARCAGTLLQYIMKEKSSESRKILLEGFEILIKKDTDEHVLDNIVENIICVEEQSISPSYIHILDTITHLLKDNNTACLKYLPDFIIKVLKTPNSEHIITNTYNLFIDKMYLYEDETLNNIVQEIIKILNKQGNKIKNKITLDFVRNILIKINKSITDFIGNIEDVKLFVSLKGCFDFDDNLKVLVLELVRDTLFDYYDLESVLLFVDMYSDILLEREYERTISLLCQIIVNLTSQQIRDNSRNIIKCMKSLKSHLKVIPQKIIYSIENYIKKINVKELSDSLEKNGFNSENESTIYTVKVMFEALDGSILSDLDSFIATWKDMFHKLYNSGYVKICLESKVNVLSDLTFVALKFMSEDEIKCIILRGPDDFGISFTCSLMCAFYPHLSASLLTHCSTLLHHVLTHTRGARGGIHLVDQIWPYYEKETTFRQKQAFLLDYLPLAPAGSAPVEWVMSTLNSDIDIENKLMILDVLPKGDLYGPLPLVLFPLLPSRLSELEGSSADCFRAILDALVVNTHTTVLEAVATLAANDPTTGWWDSAMSACMSSISRGGEEGVRLVWGACARAGPGAFQRLMMPLLRHSKSSVIESFVSSILEELLSTLRRTLRGGSCPRGVERHLIEHVRAFNILELVFQRVPREHIESPRSQLYRHMSVEAPFHLVTLVCKLCVTLRGQDLLPEDNDTRRLSLMANYKCLSAALLCRGPRARVYGSVLDPRVWRPLLTEDQPTHTRTDIPMGTIGRQCVARHTASASSVRSRVFLRTLSENPLAYDLLEEEEEIIIEEVKLPDTPLNRHPCMSAVTAVLNVVGEGAGGGEVIRGGVLQALQGEKPLAMFVAQAVCNAREALRGHSGSLTPALCALVVGRVNDLHIHVLDTIVHWRTELTECESLNKAIQCLIATMVEDGRTDSLYRMMMDKLIKLFDIYEKIVTVPWACLEKHLKDPKSKSFEMCLRILNRINIYIPELLPALSLHLEARMTLLWSVYGRVLRVTRERGGGEGELKRFRSTCEALRRSDSAEYIKALYYVQREYPPACDTSHYRSIVDLVSKIPRRERPRCLSIMAAYVERGGDQQGLLETLDLLEEMDTVQGLELAKVCLPLMSPSLRGRVCASAAARGGRGVLAEAAYQLLLRDFELNTHTEPSVKRATLTPHPHIYTAVGVARGLDQARGCVKGLSTDLGVRFCECFILCVVVPLAHNVTINLSAILDLFFQDIKQQEVFKNAKLCEDGLVFRTTSNTGTLSGNQQGTGINIQMTIEDVLSSIIKFARKVDRVSTSIIIQLIRALGATRPGFDFHETMSKNIVKCIKISPAADSVLEIARQIDVWTDLRVDEVEQLVQCTRSSEGEEASRALREELLMRKGTEFVLGTNKVKEADKGEEEDMPLVPGKFSMKDLISTFGKLSSWDSIAPLPPLPPLWTDTPTFKCAVDQYNFTDSPLWLRTAVSTYKRDDIHTYKIFKNLDKWPRKHFDISAVAESQESGSSHTHTHIHPSECMAQWAARIMAGSLYSGNSYHPSRSLSWCERGIEMSLFQQVVDCCRSVIKAEEKDSINFIHQEMLALRGMALEKNDRESLKNLLIRAESYGPLVPKSNFVDMCGINELTLRLRRDVNSLDKSHVDAVGSYIKRNTKCNIKTESLSAICVLGMTHYSETFAETTDVQEQNSLLISMCELLGLHGGLELPWSPLVSDVVLHALDHYRGQKLDPDVANIILNTLYPIINNLDECSMNQLRANKHLFPEHAMLSELHQNELSLHKYKQCLSLISDPAHLLQRYCRQLIYHLERNNEYEYKDTFIKMKRQVFEHPYSGPDYRVLYKYVNKLNEISDFASHKETTKQVLIDIQSELVSVRDTLSLSDVCPTLAQERDSESLNRLLGLRKGLRVVKFCEKLSVYTGAVSRPVLMSFLSSDGVTRRCIVKREGGGHAAVMRGRRAVGEVVGARGAYTVSTISEECLLIEYLERHTPLRALVSSVCAVDASVREAVDLVLSPGAARLRYEERCATLPPYTLRSAVEARCATFQDFLHKKKNFQESVCWMTLMNFLFGLSDRHLENILYDEESGAACDVDCGDLSHGEIPPARLTRNVLGLCDVTALEASLRRNLTRVREHQGVILPAVKMAFRNTDEKYRDKIPFIQGKMQGSLLPHQVSRECIPKSPLQHHDKYIQLLEQVFGTDTKSTYSVEEQISSLLLQCTDPRILSVTRTGWEPWI